MGFPILSKNTNNFDTLLSHRKYGFQKQIYRVIRIFLSKLKMFHLTKRACIHYHVEVYDLILLRYNSE